MFSFFRLRPDKVVDAAFEVFTPEEYAALTNNQNVNVKKTILLLAKHKKCKFKNIDEVKKEFKATIEFIRGDGEIFRYGAFENNKLARFLANELFY